MPKSDTLQQNKNLEDEQQVLCTIVSLSIYKLIWWNDAIRGMNAIVYIWVRTVLLLLKLETNNKKATMGFQVKCLITGILQGIISKTQ